MIVVAGATGRTGAEVVRAVLQQRCAVRAFVRDPVKARSLFGDTAELAVGDFADPASMRSALEGADQLFLSGADDPRRVAWESTAIDIAEAVGVRRIIKLSSIEAGPGSSVTFWSWHGRVEHRLSASEVPSVVLRSSFFMSNVLDGAEQVAQHGRLFAPAGAARIAMIDPRDVGAAAAAVLTTTGHDHRTYVLTGPAAITHAEVAAEISTATGAAVEYVAVPDDIARQTMTHAGIPEGVAGQIIEVYAMLRQGAGEHVTTDFETLTGRSPRDFASFARDHAHVFSPLEVGAGR